MNSVSRFSIHCRSPEETQALGSALSSYLREGDVLFLIGELGSGKTTFTQGVASGLHVLEDVTSPTFALVHEYGGSHPLNHIDLYRIESADELIALDYDLLFPKAAIAVVEWADRFADTLPSPSLEIAFKHRPEGRDVEIMYKVPCERWKDLRDRVENLGFTVSNRENLPFQS